MLKIKTFLAPSTVHGIGLFAGENVSKGTVIWQLTPPLDQVFGKRQFFRICKRLGERELEHIYAYIYKRNGHYYHLPDNTRFINHSDDAYNIAMTDDYREVALRDICYGEELLENYYHSYDKDDLFFLERRNVDLYKYITLTARERRRLVKSQDIS